jgi:hypothetical protein
MSRLSAKGRPQYSEYSLLHQSKPVTMGKASEEDVAIAESPVDIETIQEIQLKGGWCSRFWGTSDLDVKERKYVAKVDLYLL